MKEEKIFGQKRKCFSLDGKAVWLLLRMQMQKSIPIFRESKTVKIFLE